MLDTYLCIAMSWHPPTGTLSQESRRIPVGCVAPLVVGPYSTADGLDRRHAVRESEATSAGQIAILHAVVRTAVHQVASRHSRQCSAF
jgi:hypothetical protein